ncbi:hypothetical protein AAE478_000601 [Parahypoxylon ruwenzoriense]
MAMAAFAGISWYIGVEITISLFMIFKRRHRLYFWSFALCSWGITLQPLFIVLADFDVWTNLKGSITMIYLTWLITVVPQSLGLVLAATPDYARRDDAEMGDDCLDI